MATIQLDRDALDPGDILGVSVAGFAQNLFGLTAQVTIYNNAMTTTKLDSTMNINQFGQGSGSYTIPSNWPAGNYSVVVWEGSVAVLGQFEVVDPAGDINVVIQESFTTDLQGVRKTVFSSGVQIRNQMKARNFGDSTVECRLATSVNGTNGTLSVGGVFLQPGQTSDYMVSTIFLPTTSGTYNIKADLQVKINNVWTSEHFVFNTVTVTADPIGDIITPNADVLPATGQTNLPILVKLDIKNTGANGQFRILTRLDSGNWVQNGSFSVLSGQTVKVFDSASLPKLTISIAGTHTVSYRLEAFYPSDSQWHIEDTVSDTINISNPAPKADLQWSPTSRNSKTGQGLRMEVNIRNSGAVAGDLRAVFIHTTTGGQTVGSVVNVPADNLTAEPSIVDFPAFTAAGTYQYNLIGQSKQGTNWVTDETINLALTVTVDADGGDLLVMQSAVPSKQSVNIGETFNITVGIANNTGAIKAISVASTNADTNDSNSVSVNPGVSTTVLTGLKFNSAGVKSIIVELRTTADGALADSKAVPIAVTSTEPGTVASIQIVVTDAPEFASVTVTGVALDANNNPVNTPNLYMSIRPPSGENLTAASTNTASVQRAVLKAGAVEGDYTVMVSTNPDFSSPSASASFRIGQGGGGFGLDPLLLLAVGLGGAGVIMLGLGSGKGKKAKAAPKLK